MKQQESCLNLYSKVNKKFDFTTNENIKNLDLFNSSQVYPLSTLLFVVIQVMIITPFILFPESLMKFSAIERIPIL